MGIALGMSNYNFSYKGLIQGYVVTVAGELLIGLWACVGGGEGFRGVNYFTHCIMR